MAAMKVHHYAMALVCLLGSAACTQPAPPAEPASPAAQPVAAPGGAAEPAAPGPATDGVITHVPAGKTPATHACMIAGEFKLMGQTIRSRDCVQTTAGSTEAELKSVCEGLAQTSAQMGGKAGEITYMDACPSPSQGSCKQLFGQKFDGYYYERSADDLAGLPGSCENGGGIWSAG